MAGLFIYFYGNPYTRKQGSVQVTYRTRKRKPCRRLGVSDIVVGTERSDLLGWKHHRHCPRLSRPRVDNLSKLATGWSAGINGTRPGQDHPGIIAISRHHGRAHEYTSGHTGQGYIGANVMALACIKLYTHPVHRNNMNNEVMGGLLRMFSWCFDSVLINTITWY